MRVLGVDPGTFRMGLGLAEGEGSRHRLIVYDAVEVSRSLPLPQRLKAIYDATHKFLEAHQPEVIALEDVFYGENVATLIRIGEARASVMLAAAEKGIPVKEYPPARVKQAVTGNGRASKYQIQQMVARLFGLRTAPPPDAADALAVALCHLQSSRVRIPVG